MQIRGQKGAGTKMHKCLVGTHHHTIYINVAVYAENIMQSRGISFLKHFKLIIRSKKLITDSSDTFLHRYKYL